MPSQAPKKTICINCQPIFWEKIRTRYAGCRCVLEVGGGGRGGGGGAENKNCIIFKILSL